MNYYVKAGFLSIDVNVAIASEISPKEYCARLAVAEEAKHGKEARGISSCAGVSPVGYEILDLGTC